jgi:hypothetical protein
MVICTVMISHVVGWRRMQDAMQVGLEEETH